MVKPYEYDRTFIKCQAKLNSACICMFWGAFPGSVLDGLEEGLLEAKRDLVEERFFPGGTACDGHLRTHHTSRQDRGRTFRGPRAIDR